MGKAMKNNYEFQHMGTAMKNNNSTWVQQWQLTTAHGYSNDN